MANPQVWSGVTIAMESARGANLTISGITKANPGVATSTAHGLSNGAYVSNTISGMTELDGTLTRIAGVATNTWQIEGYDTQNFGNFSSGYANAITLGTTIGTGLTINVSGGDFEKIDYTTVSDKVRRQLIGLANPIEVSFDLIWDPSDSGFAALKSAADLKSIKAFLVTFASGYKWAFQGYVGFHGAPTGGAQEIVKTPLVITSNGRMSYYTT